MKRYPEFVYNAIDKQNIVFANQLKMSDWNNIINVLKTQANANTTFLETWTRWFFGPKEYIDEDEYAIVPEDYTNYFDYLTGMFKEIDTRIKKEINDRVAADNTLREYTDLKHGITMETIYKESEQRISKDNEIVSRVENVENITSSHTSTLSSIVADVSRHRDTLQQHTEEIDKGKAEDENLQNQIRANETNTAKKINTDFSNLAQASKVHKDDSIIIRCNGTTYTITVSYLSELLGTGVSLFKGYFNTFESLVTNFPESEAGSYAFVGSKDDEQYHMYVWDDRDGGVWEETISGQYVGTSTFDTFQQRLQEGLFHVGAIKGNVENPSNSSPLLYNIEINGEQYVIPNIALDFLGNAVDGAYKLGAIKINGDTWNINNDIVKLEMSDENIDGAYELGSIVINGNKWNVVKFSDVLNKIAEFNNNANAYTDTKNAETLNSAKAYADAIKKAILGEGISETFDTLKEIQSWIEGDGVNASELSKAVANKQDKLTAGNGISISTEGVISVSYPNYDEEEF